MIASNPYQLPRRLGIWAHDPSADLERLALERILPRVEDYPACWPVLREYFGEIRPANTMLVVALGPRHLIVHNLSRLRPPPRP